MLRATLFLRAPKRKQFKCLWKGTTMMKDGETLRWNITQRWEEGKHYWYMNAEWERRSQRLHGAWPRSVNCAEQAPSNRTEPPVCLCWAGRGGEQGPRAPGCQQYPKLPRWHWHSSEESKPLGCVSNGRSFRHGKPRSIALLENEKRHQLNRDTFLSKPMDTDKWKLLVTVLEIMNSSWYQKWK